MEAGCLFSWEKSFFFLAGLLVPSPYPVAALLPPGGGGSTQAAAGIEAATVPKIPLSGSRRLDEYHTKKHQKGQCSVLFLFFYIYWSKGGGDVSTPQLSLLLIQGKDQRIDNSIKFMFIERVPRGSLQPIAERIQS